MLPWYLFYLRLLRSEECDEVDEEEEYLVLLEPCLLPLLLLLLWSPGECLSRLLPEEASLKPGSMIDGSKGRGFNLLEYCNGLLNCWLLPSPKPWECESERAFLPPAPCCIAEATMGINPGAEDEPFVLPVESSKSLRSISVVSWFSWWSMECIGCDDDDGGGWLIWIMVGGGRRNMAIIGGPGAMGGGGAGGPSCWV